MPKTRLLSACRPNGSGFSVSVNSNQGGGDKKGGLPPTTNKRVEFILRAISENAYSSPSQRRTVSCSNQLSTIGYSGAGNGSTMFSGSADGVRKPCFNLNGVGFRRVR